MQRCAGNDTIVKFINSYLVGKNIHILKFIPFKELKFFFQREFFMGCDGIN